MTVIDDFDNEEKARADKRKLEADDAAAKAKADAEVEARRIAREEAKKVIDEEIEPADEKKGKG